MTATNLVLGVDGGGTKTLAWLAAASGDDVRPLSEGHSGPGNPRAVGFDAALQNLGTAVDAAFANAGLATATVSSACLALAGADRPMERSRVEEWAKERRLANRLRVTNDAEPILAAASDDGLGIALICGTGSFAWGRNRSGATARCGGWGYLLGDEGSGYHIALAGLRAAARAADGRGDPTMLLDQFQHQLGASAPTELIQAIYRPEIGREQIASLSTIVFEAASQNDPIARQIVNSAADELAQLVGTLVGKLGLQPNNYALAMVGGVLVHSPDFRKAIAHRLADASKSPESITLVPQPVLGAVVMARRELQNVVGA